MRILVWHVHGSWTTAFVQGGHDYLLPVLPDRGPQGRGRAQTWDWPAAAVEVSPDQLRDTDIDLVVLQRPEELQLVEEWTGRRPGEHLPAVYLEHNTPRGPTPFTRHPVADRRDLPLVHVTHFNRLIWDNGSAPTTVVEHGVVDPGHRYTGELERAATAINEPVRRGRAVGTDLLPGLAEAAPLDVFGMGVAGLGDALGLAAGQLGEHDDLPQEAMHAELARRRVFVHPHRWTSLGLSLIEAMQLGMPVACLATTEAPRAVPETAGLASPDPAELQAFVRRMLADPDEARAVGQAARQHALSRYGLKRFLDDWDQVLAATA